ncbi:MAG: hypothetical protein ACR2K9_04945 [Solirubrobacteraceae bacterium]
MTGCAYVAQVGDTGAATPGKAGIAQTGQTAGVAGGVTVFTFSSRSNGAQASDESFHLAVFC